MLTIGRLAKRFGLTGSTLLHYDRIGLLSPTGRTSSNYRVYSNEDADRLGRITNLRRAGVSLNHIRKILDADQAGLKTTLENRLGAINEDLSALRDQQRLIAHLLQDESVLSATGSPGKDGWIAILSASGLSEAEMDHWHAQFERLNPDAHREFLRAIGFEDREVKQIRARARFSA